MRRVLLKSRAVLKLLHDELWYELMSNKTLSIQYDFSLFSEQDIYLFKEGRHFRLYNKFGAHPVCHRNVGGVYFAVWAPNARYVSVMGDFNDWDKGAHPLQARWDSSGVWEGFVPKIGPGALYKFFIHSNNNDYQADKIDPYAFYAECPPRTSSIVWDLQYAWKDQAWMETRRQKNALDAPISIYEIHLGSWRRKVEEQNRALTYKEMTSQLIEYIKKMGFTHIELLPVMEHPFYGSWGYQVLGYFAPTNRYGTPQDFMYFVDQLHQNDIGVFLDWVPSHFPSDGHGLVYYDGTHLYEHADPQKGFHPDWKSYIFNYSRNEVKEFLISNALFWMDRYHIDGFRVDAVASMLYLDYSRKEGEWSPNIYGGRENIEAIDLIRDLNQIVYQEYPDIQMIAEESTSWPQVSRPVSGGGLGFGMKWNMGWMHDTLKYFSLDTIYRKHHHNDLTFSMLYAFHENFILILSHDEVVYGKGSLLRKMPGDNWQKFANLRLLLGYMFAHPGKKLLFMGGEFGQWDEWQHEKSLDWHLLEFPEHQQISRLVCDLNRVYRSEASLSRCDFDYPGFEWIHMGDWEKSILVFARKDPTDDSVVMAACNFTPTPQHQYRIGTICPGLWKEIINTDAQVYGGSGFGNGGQIRSVPVPYHGRDHSLLLNLPPLGVLLLKWDPASLPDPQQPKQD